MRFEEYKNSANFNHKKIQLSFGEFFICDNFVVAELNHEIHVDWLISSKNCKYDY